MRYLLGLCLLAAAAVVAVSFHHPPMRLMPPPIVFAGAKAEVFAPDDPSSYEPRIELFYATNRLPIGPDDSRLYAVVPGRYLRAGVATVRIGDSDTPWEKIRSWSRSADDQRRPFLNLENLTESAILTGMAGSEEAKAWFGAIDEALQRSTNRNVIVYVHGANTTVERAAGQAAQLLHFTGRNAVVVLFVWPTAENFLRYSRDMVTAFEAAPHLTELIHQLATHTTARNIDVFTYSAGATVGSDALVLLGRETKAASRLGEVYHAAPDADFRDFVDDLRDYADHAERITVAVNLGDSALRLSQVVHRASRAGRPDMAELDQESTDWLLDAVTAYRIQLVRVRPENIPGLSPRSHTFWYDDPWVSSDVLVTLLFHLGPSGRGLAEGRAPSGARYWTFAADYPERLAEAMNRFSDAKPDQPPQTLQRASTRRLQNAMP